VIQRTLYGLQFGKKINSIAVKITELRAVKEDTVKFTHQQSARFLSVNTSLI